MATIPNSNPYGAAAIGPDGNYWFGLFSTPNMSIAVYSFSQHSITETGNLPMSPPPPRGLPSSTISGLAVANGQMYYTDGLCEIAGLNSALQVTGASEVPPCPSEYPQIQGLVTGSDGGLWFVNSGLASLGRVDPNTGAYSTIAVDTICSRQGMYSIISGPDDALWFLTCSGIGHYVIGGSIGYFPINSETGGSGMVSNSDGNVWSGGALSTFFVVKVSSTGAETQYNLPNVAFAPQVVVAARGNVYFQFGQGSDSGPYGIGKVTPAGVVSLYQTSNAYVNQRMGQFVLGPDGDIYATAAGQVIRFAPP